MASRKNKWRKRGRLEFRRETARYSDRTPMGYDTLYVRIRKVACVIVQPFESTSYGPNQVSVLLGTYRIARPAKAANYARDYLNYKAEESRQ
jgi:hypothetical protein